MSIGRARDYMNSPAGQSFIDISDGSVYSCEHVKKKLADIIQSGAIPNLLFHGKPGSGKRTIVNWFMLKLYNTPEISEKMVYYVDCNVNNGIQYIRDEVHFIAKKNIDTDSAITFKTILFLNADKLTIDAQSALRRCMEIHDKHTRFIFVTSYKSLLTKPILSRMGHIHVMPKDILGNYVDVNLIRKNNELSYITEISSNLEEYLDSIVLDVRNNNPSFLINVSRNIVDMGYSALNVIEYIVLSRTIDPSVKYRNISAANYFRKLVKNEEALIFIILSDVLIRKETDMKKICAL